MRWIDTGRAALRYRLDGERGPLLVLVHEMGGVIESWDGVVPSLDSHCRILRYDTRGAGMSEKISDDIAIEDMADDVAALLDALGIDEPVHIAGCAVGAGIALSFAARHPGRTSGVIVMNPAIGVTAENRPGLLARAEKLQNGGTRAIVAESLALGYPQLFRDRDPAHFALFQARWLANDPVSLSQLFLMLARTDLSAALGRIHCPVLGISGKLDPLRTVEYVKGVLAQIADTELVVIEAGHHMPDQAPDLVAREIRGFLERRGAIESLETRA
jgi:3-oxoadipate enol-lactonase